MKGNGKKKQNELAYARVCQCRNSIFCVDFSEFNTVFSTKKKMWKNKKANLVYGTYCLAVHIKRLLCRELLLWYAHVLHKTQFDELWQQCGGGGDENVAEKKKVKWNETVFMEITFWLISYLHCISWGALQHTTCCSCMTYRWHEIGIIIIISRLANDNAKRNAFIFQFEINDFTLKSKKFENAIVHLHNINIV